jgi:hypothetical protein
MTTPEKSTFTLEEVDSDSTYAELIARKEYLLRLVDEADMYLSGRLPDEAPALPASVPASAAADQVCGVPPWHTHYDFCTSDDDYPEDVTWAMAIAAAGGHHLLLASSTYDEVGAVLRLNSLRSAIDPASFEAVRCAFIARAHTRVAGSPAFRPFRAPANSSSDEQFCTELHLAQHGVLYLNDVLHLRDSARDRLWHMVMHTPLQGVLIVATQDITNSPEGFDGLSRILQGNLGSVFDVAVVEGPDGYDPKEQVKRVTSEGLRRRVVGARQFAMEADAAKHLARSPDPAVMTEAEIRLRGVSKHAYKRVDAWVESLGCPAASKAFARLRVLRVARTCANLGRAKTIKLRHLEEALEFVYVPVSWTRRRFKE